MSAIEDYETACKAILSEWDYSVLETYPENAPRNAKRYGAHAEVRRDLERHGSHFYDRQALRFFNAKTSDAHTAGGRFWVESKRFETDPRTYQVAWIAESEAGYLSVERSRDYDTLAEARAARSTLAAAVLALA